MMYEYNLTSHLEQLESEKIFMVQIEDSSTGKIYIQKAVKFYNPELEQWIIDSGTSFFNLNGIGLAPDDHLKISQVYEK
jgi:hypothetical protein